MKLRFISCPRPVRLMTIARELHLRWAEGSTNDGKTGLIYGRVICLKSQISLVPCRDGRRKKNLPKKNGFFPVFFRYFSGRKKIRKTTGKNPLIISEYLCFSPAFFTKSSEVTAFLTTKFRLLARNVTNTSLTEFP